MTAGSGIYHQEMPMGDKTGKMYGFQLWANLPKNNKMMEPRYRGIISNQIPIVKKGNGVQIKVIAGNYDGTVGPIRDVVINPEYYDIFIPKNVEYVQQTIKGNRVMFYVFEGKGYIETSINGTKEKKMVCDKNMVLFEDGDYIKISTDNNDLRFLMISGKQINESIAWYGPIVMNTDEELNIAYDELRKGTFIK
jgi:redox-sensitive bicupin YhaK (pirin superfamily)